MPEERRQAIAALRRPALHRRPDRRVPRHARDHGLRAPAPEGLGRLDRLGLEPARRYERSRPGELIHIDVKKLGRIAVAGHRVTGDRQSQSRRFRARRRGALGFEFVHVCVDDATRLAYCEVLPDGRP